MAASALAAYVGGRLQAGVSKAVIKGELLAVGWTEDEAEAAYRDGLIALGVPLPDAGNRPSLARKSSTVDIVVNFFSFILLGIVATALGTLCFQIINAGFPDPLAATDADGEWGMTRAIHHAIASLVIAFPLYLATMRLWFRKFDTDPGQTESLLSRWLTYLVLLVASVTIVGDLIAVLSRLLQGEITARFLLKALVILVIAGLVFGFYTLERRRIQYRKDIPARLLQSFGWATGAVVVAGIVVGFFAAGSPETARKRAFDLQRERNLAALSGCIERYARDLGQLPASLEPLRSASRYASCAAFMHDPETGRRYAYRVVTPSRAEGPAQVADFELCASFALGATADDRRRPSPGGPDAIWSVHGAGRSCDIVTVQLVGAVKPATPAADAAPATSR